MAAVSEPGPHNSVIRRQPGSARSGRWKSMENDAFNCAEILIFLVIVSDLNMCGGGYCSPDDPSSGPPFTCPPLFAVERGRL